MSHPVFLDVEDVLLIHEEQLAKYGGAAGVRDAALLESAVAMPRATAGGEFAHEDLFAMAAAYAFHIAQNQPFVDGNKRTGLLAAIVFMDLNGLAIADPEGRLYDAMISIAQRRLDKAGLAALLNPLTVKAFPTKGVHRREVSHSRSVRVRSPAPPLQASHAPVLRGLFLFGP